MLIGRYDYMAQICMIIICITPHISVCDYWLLTAISVNVWPYQCAYQSMYVSMYYIQSSDVRMAVISADAADDPQVGWVGNK